jgi:hypothetical protein
MIDAIRTDSNEAINIERILDKHEAVYIDTGILLNSGFLWSLYEIDKFEKLDRNSLLGETENLKEMIKIFSHPNTLTTPEVIEEIRDYTDIINEKVQYLSSHCSLPHYRTHDGKTYVNRVCSVNDTTAKREDINMLQKAAFEYYQKAKRKAVKIKDAKFKTLAEMVKDVSKTMYLKKDLNFYYNKPEKDPYRTDSDEKLVSSVYWRMIMGENESLALISCDTDFKSLLGNVSEFLGADYFLPYNREFKERILNSNFTLYIKNRGDHPELPLISEYKIDEIRGFGLQRFEPETLAGLKERLMERWKEFCG